MGYFECLRLLYECDMRQQLSSTGRNPRCKILDMEKLDSMHAFTCKPQVQSMTLLQRLVEAVIYLPCLSYSWLSNHARSYRTDEVETGWCIVYANMREDIISMLRSRDRPPFPAHGRYRFAEPNKWRLLRDILTWHQSGGRAKTWYSDIRSLTFLPFGSNLDTQFQIRKLSVECEQWIRDYYDTWVPDANVYRTHSLFKSMMETLYGTVRRYHTYRCDYEGWHLHGEPLLEPYCAYSWRCFIDRHAANELPPKMKSLWLLEYPGTPDG